jgi:hypothetical protein
MHYVNWFADGTALLEREPQGDANVPVSLPARHEKMLVTLIDSPETSEALAALFLAGATAGERAVRVRPILRPFTGIA